jgi:hypothetical protein
MAQWRNGSSELETSTSLTACLLPTCLPCLRRVGLREIDNIDECAPIDRPSHATTGCRAPDDSGTAHVCCHFTATTFRRAMHQHPGHELCQRAVISTPDQHRCCLRPRSFSRYANKSREACRSLLPLTHKRRPLRGPRLALLPPLRLALRLADTAHAPRYPRRPQREAREHRLDPLLPRTVPTRPSRHSLPLSKGLFDESCDRTRLHQVAHIEHSFGKP